MFVGFYLLFKIDVLFEYFEVLSTSVIENILFDYYEHIFIIYIYTIVCHNVWSNTVQENNVTYSLFAI